MSRVISQYGPGNERKNLSNAIVAGIRQLVKQEKFDIDDIESKDIISFTILSLEEISKSVERSVAAWEKRNYWIKADRFRLEWAWALKCAQTLRSSYAGNDLTGIIQVITEVGSNLNGIKISDRNRIGTPWKGFRKRLN